MQHLTEQILAHAERLPEGTPLAAKSLLHLGNRAGVDQDLSRLAGRGQLIRAGRGVYLHPIKSRFGTRAPSEQAVEALAAQRGEIIVPNGAAAANALGLTTQVTVRSVYLTSGRSRHDDSGRAACGVAACAALAVRLGQSPGRTSGSRFGLARP